MIVRMTVEDMKAEPDGGTCPMTRAIRRVFRQVDPSWRAAVVGTNRLSATDDCGRVCGVYLPPEAVSWVYGWDNGVWVDPISFVLELPWYMETKWLHAMMREHAAGLGVSVDRIRCHGIDRSGKLCLVVADEALPGVDIEEAIVEWEHARKEG